MGVLIRRALLFGVHIGAHHVWKLPDRVTAGWEGPCMLVPLQSDASAYVPAEIHRAYVCVYMTRICLYMYTCICTRYLYMCIYIHIHISRMYIGKYTYTYVCVYV